MGLAGAGVVAIWNGIRPEARAEFYEWHNREHMPERVGIPGFLRGRRYRALEGHPEYFTLYETRDTAVLAGADYLARLNAPTPWTRKVTPSFTDTARSLCRVALSFGRGGGGMMLTLRFEGTGLEEKLRMPLEQIAKQAGIAGAYLCIADRGASGIRTEEKKDRPEDAVPGCVLMVEGAAERAALDSLSNDILEKLGVTSIERGLYQLQHVLTHNAG